MTGPRRFGPYELERELARGGMGVVYAARHTETGAAYALKTIQFSAGALDADDMARFRREGELLSRLDHPGIVRVHSAGVEDGVAYLVQALLPGGSLQARLRRSGPLPWEEAVALVAELADAVAYAHAQGTLHRDLKPDNVLFDERGRPVLVDFGLGRDLGAESRRMTETGQMMGTPGYMAPEQIEGTRGDDPRTDVYGLGAILFTLIAGRPPFTGQGLGILAQIVHDAPPGLASLEPDTPRHVAATVACCLAKQPEGRFASAADLASALRSGEAPTARRDRRPVVLGGVLAMVLIALGLAAVWTPEPPAVANPDASTPQSRPSTPSVDPAWEQASWQADPVKAAAIVAEATGRPLPAAAKRLLANANRRASALNASKKMSLQVSKEVITEGQRRTWIACIQVYRKVAGGPVPDEMLSDLPHVISLLPVDAGWFVEKVLGALEPQYVPELAASVLEYVNWLKARSLLLKWWEPCRSLVLRVPSTNSTEWKQGRVRLIGLFQNLNDPLANVSAGPDGPSDRATRERSRDALIWCQELLKVGALPPDERRLVARVRAAASLRVRDAIAAERIARDGWERLGDRSCRGLLALALFRCEREQQALQVARGYIASNRAQRGMFLHDVVLGLLWDLGTPAELEAEVRALIEARSDFHGWRLREVLLLLKLKRPRLAQTRLLELQRAIRTAEPNLPSDTWRYPITKLGDVQKDPKPLRSLIERLDEVRRRKGVALP